jgi:hypothetical protein
LLKRKKHLVLEHCYAWSSNKISGFTPEELKEAIKMIFNRKGERIVEENLRVWDAGINA